MVSRVLGHKSLQTAISNYASEDLAISMRASRASLPTLCQGGGWCSMTAQQLPTGQTTGSF